jgi:hypothetical protein
MMRLLRSRHSGSLLHPGKFISLAYEQEVLGTQGRALTAVDRWAMDDGRRTSARGKRSLFYYNHANLIHGRYFQAVFRRKWSKEWRKKNARSDWDS